MWLKHIKLACHLLSPVLTASLKQTVLPWANGRCRQRRRLLHAQHSNSRNSRCTDLYTHKGFIMNDDSCHDSVRSWFSLPFARWPRPDQFYLVTLFSCPSCVLLVPTDSRLPYLFVFLPHLLVWFLHSCLTPPTSLCFWHWAQQLEAETFVVLCYS